MYLSKYVLLIQICKYICMLQFIEMVFMKLAHARILNVAPDLAEEFPLSDSATGSVSVLID